MSRCAPRKHSTDAKVKRDNGLIEKIQVFVFSCLPCGIVGKTFESKSQRDKLAAQHK